MEGVLSLDLAKDHFFHGLELVVGRWTNTYILGCLFLGERPPFGGSKHSRALMADSRGSCLDVIVPQVVVSGHD